LGKIQGNESSQAVAQKKTRHFGWYVLAGQINRCTQIRQILSKRDNVTPVSATATVPPVIGCPHADGFWEQALDNIAVPAGMLPQAMGDHQAGPFRFRRVVPIKEFNSVGSLQFAG
jgi:hypothetical protein